MSAETRTADGISTTVSYTYDQLNRLATAISASGGTTNWGLGFSYDVYGNRTAQTVTAGDQSVPNFQVAFNNKNQMIGYGYDDNGNQLNAAGGATLEYDEENRLKKWTKQGQTEEYRYHPAGWRLSNSNDGSYLYGPGGQLLTKSAARYTDYVYFAGRLLFTMSEGQMDPRLTRLTRVYNDRLGSTRATWVATYGGGSTTRNYYPFGEEIGSTSNDQYKFASTYRDSATGLDYAINRYYASGTGRFLTGDPESSSMHLSAPISLNRYSYAFGDPVNYRDPGALDPCQYPIPGVPCFTATGTAAAPGGGGGGGAGGGGGGGSDGMEVVQNTDSPAMDGTGVGPVGLNVRNFQRGGAAINGVLGKIEDALGNYSDCAAWLQGGGVAGADLIKAVRENQTFGHGDFYVGDQQDVGHAAFAGTRLPDGTPVGVPADAAFTVNDNGAFFSAGQSVGPRSYQGGTLRAQAQILIHELAHILGAAGVKSDFNDAKAGRANDELVDKKCGKLIRSLK